MVCLTFYGNKTVREVCSLCQCWCWTQCPHLITIRSQDQSEKRTRCPSEEYVLSQSVLEQLIILLLIACVYFQFSYKVSTCKVCKVTLSMDWLVFLFLCICFSIELWTAFMHQQVFVYSFSTDKHGIPLFTLKRANHQNQSYEIFARLQQYVTAITLTLAKSIISPT